MAHQNLSIGLDRTQIVEKLTNVSITCFINMFSGFERSDFDGGALEQDASRDQSLPPGSHFTGRGAGDEQVRQKQGFGR